MRILLNVYFAWLEIESFGVAFEADPSVPPLLGPSAEIPIGHDAEPSTRSFVSLLPNLKSPRHVKRRAYLVRLQVVQGKDHCSEIFDELYRQLPGLRIWAKISQR